MEQKVVIIGAGVSGLAAAQRLCSAGVSDVVILEAEDRIGGRIHTVDCDGHKIELGAQWIHGAKGNAIFELLSKNVDLVEDDAMVDGGEAFFASTRSVTEEIEDVFEISCELMDQICQEVTERVGKFQEAESNLKEVSLLCIAKEVWKKKFATKTPHDNDANQTVLKSILDGMSIVDGKSADKIGCLMYYYYNEIPGGDVLIPGGYSVLLDALMKDIPSSIVKFNCKVHSIYWDLPQKPLATSCQRLVNNASTLGGSDANSSDYCNSDQYRSSHLVQENGSCLIDVDAKSSNSNRFRNLVSQNGDGLQQNGRQVGLQYSDKDGNIRSIYADHVIVTVSLGCLKKLHKTLFLPNLSLEKQKYLGILGFGAADKVILHYKDPFWGDDGFCIYPLWDHYEGSDVFANESHWCRHLYVIYAFQQNCLVTWLNEEAYTKVRDLPEVEIGRTLVEMMQKFKTDIAIPQPDVVILTKWGENDNFLGSYSCTGVGETLEAKKKVFEPLMVGVVPRVLFAGEATHESRFSTVDGAYLSGLREADRLFEFFNRPSN